MRIGILILLILFVTNVASQVETESDKVNVIDYIDTLIIDRDVNNWSIRTYGSYKDNRFQIANADHKISYVPNNPYGLGIGIATKKVILDAGINITSISEDQTERFDIQVTAMVGEHHFDYFLQSYHGYNVITDMGQANSFREDFSSFSTGLNYMYLFNAEEYSVLAMKSGLSRQKSTAIAFGLGGFIFMDRTIGDSSLVPSSMQTLFNEQALITSLYVVGGGVLGGFSVTVPFHKRFFLSASISSGIGLIDKQVQTETVSYKPKDPFMYQVSSAGYFGYNGKKFYVNLSAGIAFFMTNLDYGNKVTYNTTKAKLAIGYMLFKK